MMRKLFTFALLAGVLLAAASAQAGKVYKWVDKDGNVHYSNTPPPEASQQERQVLDEHGNVTEVLRAPKTPEEIEAERKAQEQRERERQLAEQQAARDRMLLETYTSVRDMERDRDGRLAAIDAQIRVIGNAIGSLEAQLASMEQQKQQIQANGRPVPEDLEKRIVNTREELLKNQKSLLERKNDQDELRERFEMQIRRFKELKGLQ